MAIDLITLQRIDLPLPQKAIKKAATKSLTQIRKKKTNFFSLPGELRNKIYGYALPQGKGISLDGTSFQQLIFRRSPGIVFADVRLFKEAGSVYFLDNTFWFEQDTLNIAGFSVFEDVLGQHARRLKQIGIRRHYQIGDMKPITISFMVEIKNGRITIVRPTNEELPFPGVPGYAKFRSPYAEPCRCEVRAVATRLAPTSKRSANGLDLLDFVRDYIKLVRQPGNELDFRICQVCERVRRR
ncbi:hypothetical protein PRZ48_001775 [Zasmidium cellare]|uniref:Uncharacterized protein n=1 Tax=Zasmidium cellare TaxID=395010 RepID=A0ABR0F3J3_ZASCE|nr:hypothetical protein PRZ48_001775 [Zasmidium cellare]